MPSRRSRKIDRLVEDALQDFSLWLKDSSWQGKERDCVNLFAHKFLFAKIAPNAPIHCPTQVCIECALKQPAGPFTKLSAPKDLVIWGEPMQNTWTREWTAVHAPLAVMEWKTRFCEKQDTKRAMHDEVWIAAYVAENPSVSGYVVSVDIRPGIRDVRWKRY
jgi:hypothetical protein